jgi:hypothetical protein
MMTKKLVGPFFRFIFTFLNLPIGMIKSSLPPKKTTQNRQSNVAGPKSKLKK